MTKGQEPKWPAEIALSIRQPWASLIVNGHKDIENRSWSTKFRGKFLVHAGKRFDGEGYEWVQDNFRITLPERGEFQRGGIVGVAELVDCVERHRSKWFSGDYGFVLKNARRLRFYPMPGRLGFFKVDRGR